MKILFLLLFAANIALSQTFVTIKDASINDQAATVYKTLLIMSLKDEISKNPKLILKEEPEISPNAVIVEILIITTDKISYSVNTNFLSPNAPRDYFLTNIMFISGDYEICAKLIYSRLTKAISDYSLDLKLPELPASFEQIK